MFLRNSLPIALYSALCDAELSLHKTDIRATVVLTRAYSGLEPMKADDQAVLEHIKSIHSG